MAPANAVLARLGGDEFAVCVAERAALALGAAEQFVAEVRRYTPGTSVGLASESGGDAEIAALLAAADANLYAAKQYRAAATRDPDLGHAI
jgi:GGDEF domain-containing protein